MALPLLCEVEISSRLLRDLFPTSKSCDIFEYLKRISQKFRRCSHLKRSKKGKKEKHSTLKEKVYRDLYRNISHNNCRYFISIFIFSQSFETARLNIYLHCNRKKSIFIAVNVILTFYYIVDSRHFVSRFAERGQERRLRDTSRSRRSEKRKTYSFDIATD